MTIGAIGWFVKIPRCLESIPHSSEYSRHEAIVDLYSLAPWRAHEFQKRAKKIRLRESQILRSVEFFQKRWNRWRKWVKSFLADMQQKGLIAYELSRDGVLISVNQDPAKKEQSKIWERNERESSIDKDKNAHLTTEEDGRDCEKGTDSRRWELNKDRIYNSNTIYSNATFDDINKQIPVLDILHKCGYETFRKSNTERGIKENGQKTSGHSASIDKNIVFELNKGKCRPCGGPVALIKRLYGVSGKEIIEVAEREYGFRRHEFRIDNQHYPATIPKPVISPSWPSDNPKQEEHWGLLPITPATRHIEYAIERWVSITALTGILRFKGNRLALAIRNPATGGVVGIQTRESGSCDKESRYSIVSWGTQHGYFHDFPAGIETDSAIPRKILIVEGFTDYLSVRQITPYVIGIPSASSNCQDFSQFERFGCGFVMIPHLDKPGEWLFEKLYKIVPMEQIRLEWYNSETNDVNDYLVRYGHAEVEHLLREAWVSMES